MKWVFCWLFCAVLVCGDEPSEKFFAGGDSEIASDDPERAEKAVAKWTEANEELEGEPWFWDRAVVGRAVFLRVVKAEERLEVWLEDPVSRKFALFKSYRIARFSGKPGPKMAEGDWQAPEGFYYISRRRMNPQSRYHLSMDMGYPNAYDRSHERTGSYLMIHGSNVSIGCYAMTDASIEQIYTLVDAALRSGQPFVRVHAFPFVMSKENLAAEEGSEHYEFWENLKEGWDWFEKERRPPAFEVETGRYTFSAEG